MEEKRNNNASNQRNTAFNTADSGNASNPSPHNDKWEPVEDNQLLDKKAETYLREAGNIEDEPDAEQQEDMDEKMKGE
jgi:hypothetical protein